MFENIGCFREMLLKTLVAIIGQKYSFGYSKRKIWDTNQYFSATIGDRKITAFKGIKISLFFDKKYVYVTMSPGFTYEDGIKLSRVEKKQFSDFFHGGINKLQANMNVKKYICNWTDRLFNGSNIKVKFPLNSNTGFDFAIGHNTALLGVSFGKSSITSIPKDIHEKRFVINGIECKDPELVFCNPQQKKMVKDFHPMRGLSFHAPVDNEINESVLRSTISLGVICPQNSTQQFQGFINQLQHTQNVGYNFDFVIQFPGFNNAFKTGLNIPAVESEAWVSVVIPSKPNIKQAAIELGKEITRKLDQLNAMQIDVVIIYIPQELESLTEFLDDEEKFDLHDFVKAYAAQKNIATQFIREKTLADKKMYCQIMWALSLAIYVKSCRIPWIIADIQKDTAFVGIGYSINQSKSGSQILVGCSHIYSADGQGMKYKLARINEYTLDGKKNPYLTENEAYRLGLSIKELFYKSFTEFPKRV
ncbi:MAG: hypothetical protein LBD23_14670, partial [Oscillospiraceae bacterium]|nr:hypothetical protein [Oscillospiraceae bacterium]